MPYAESTPNEEQAALMKSLGFILYDSDKMDHSLWKDAITGVSLYLPDKMKPSARHVMRLALDEAVRHGAEQLREGVRKLLGIKNII